MEVSKKKPGRPRLQKPVKAEKITGISVNPMCVDNIVEMAYANPGMFKKLFKMYKEYGVQEIQLVFDKNTIKFTMQNDPANIITTIYAEQINHYYCRTPIVITVSREKMEKALAALNKKTSLKITFILKEDSYKNSLFIIILDSEYENNKQYCVGVIKTSEINKILQPPDSGLVVPHLQFTLNAKHFKSQISDIEKLSSQLIIQKIYKEPLQFTFTDSKQLPFNSIYKSEEKISLVNNMEPGSLFTITLPAGHVKPFSNAALGEYVIISSKMGEYLKLESILDKNENAISCKLEVEITLL